MAALVPTAPEAAPAEAPAHAPGSVAARPWGRRMLVAAALVLLVAAAAALRLARLGDQPGGLFQDEAAEGLDAWRILHQPGFHPLFFADDGGREVTFAYIVAAVLHLTGSGERRTAFVAPGERLDLSASELSVAVGEGGPGHGALPPGDRADVDRAHAPDHADLRV